MLHNCHDVKYKSNYLMLYGFILLLVKLWDSGMIVGSSISGNDGNGSSCEGCCSCGSLCFRMDLE